MEGKNRRMEAEMYYETMWLDITKQEKKPYQTSNAERLACYDLKE